MLACVCQPAETRLYQGGRAAPLGPLGGPRRPLQRPRGLKSRPPKPPPKPQSSSTTSDDTKSSPSQQKSPNNLLSLRKIEERSKTTKISSISSANSEPSPVKRPKENSSPNIQQKLNVVGNREINFPFKKGNQEKLLKTCNDNDDATHRRKLLSCKDKRVSSASRRNKSTTPEQSVSEQRDSACNGVVTITDNDGKIYCVDNLILVGEDLLGKIKSDYGDSAEEHHDTSNNTKAIRRDKLTVKNKTDDTSTEAATSCEGTNATELPEGVELTLGELRAMALRQQQQIDCQHQLLAAREQRLRFLKQQEARHHQVAAENERLRRLRERVEAQELKLRRLRALRGQLDQTNLNNVALTSDLESIRALFNEKEKELSVAVAKVEELTRQLEDVRRGRAPPRSQPPAALELDKLRRELMYRNKLNEQQNARLSQQREALTARQAEMASIDQRISELQGRLQRKRVANRQLATQITGKHHAPRSNNPAPVQLSNYPSGGTGPNVASKTSQVPRGNIAAVEPYNHIPHAPSVNHGHNFQALKHNAAQNNLPMKLVNQAETIGGHLSQQEAHYLQQKQFTNQVFSNGAYPQRLQTNLLQTEAQFAQQYPSKQNEINAYQTQQGLANQQVQNDQKILLDHINKYNIDLQKNVNHNHNQNNIQQPPHNQQGINKQRQNEQEFLPEFAASKSDPKYQTLPYNTKFTANGSTKQKGQFYDDGGKSTNEPSAIVKVSSSSNVNNVINSGSNLNHMTAHSTPLTISKGLATPLAHNLPEGNSAAYHHSEPSGYHLQRSESGNKCNQEEKENLGHTNVRMGQVRAVDQMKYKIQEGAGGRADLVRGFSQHTTVTSTGQMPQSGPNDSNSPQQSYQNAESAIPPVPTTDPPVDPDNPNQNNHQSSSASSTDSQQMIIKARPLTIRKQPLSEQPKLKSLSNNTGKINAVTVATNRRIEMPPSFLFPEMEQTQSESSGEMSAQGKGVDKINGNKLQFSGTNTSPNSCDVTDRAVLSPESSETSSEDQPDRQGLTNIADQMNAVDINNANGDCVSRRVKKGNLKQSGKVNLSRRVSFDPLALLLDASLEGELELVKKTATQVANASAANDEGITALHNAICAGHFEIVKFLVEFGCDVNAQDSDGWTPLHCAASCNNVAMVRFLVENGACIFATTLSDHETAAQKCEEDEEGFDGCSEYLYSVQEKLGILNGGAVYAVFPYSAHEPDELSFVAGVRLGVLRKGDDAEREWWWARTSHGQEGYVPRNLLGLYPRVTPKQEQ